MIELDQPWQPLDKRRVWAFLGHMCEWEKEVHQFGVVCCVFLWKEKLWPRRV